MTHALVHILIFAAGLLVSYLICLKDLKKAWKLKRVSEAGMKAFHERENKMSEELATAQRQAEQWGRSMEYGKYIYNQMRESMQKCLDQERSENAKLREECLVARTSLYMAKNQKP